MTFVGWWALATSTGLWLESTVSWPSIHTSVLLKTSKHETILTTQLTFIHKWSRHGNKWYSFIKLQTQDMFYNMQRCFTCCVMISLCISHHPCHDYLNSLSRETQGGEIFSRSEIVKFIHSITYFKLHTHDTKCMRMKQ